MNEQTKELAKQAGFHITSSNFGDIGWVWCSDGYPIDEQLDALVKLVRQDEREACAKLCEEVGRQTAAAIRARNEPNPAFKNYMGDNWAGIV